MDPIVSVKCRLPKNVVPTEVIDKIARTLIKIEKDCEARGNDIFRTLKALVFENAIYDLNQVYVIVVPHNNMSKWKSVLLQLIPHLESELNGTDVFVVDSNSRRPKEVVRDLLFPHPVIRVRHVYTKEGETVNLSLVATPNEFGGRKLSLVDRLATKLCRKNISITLHNFPLTFGKDIPASDMLKTF